MEFKENQPKDPLTGVILGAAFEVANTLGHGFLEGIYQRALAHELVLRGLLVEREVYFSVSFFKCFSALICENLSSSVFNLPTLSSSNSAAEMYEDGGSRERV